MVQWNADDVLDATNALTYSITSQTVAGAYAINSDTGVITVANGSLLNFETQASHTITVRTTDGSGATFDKTLTITLNDVADEPTNNTPASQSTNEDTNLVFSVANGNAITVTDQNGSANTPMEVSLVVPSGTLTLSQTTGLTFVSGSNGSASMVIWGTESDLNSALNGLTFTPAGNYNGTIQLTVQSSLNNGLQGYYTFDGGNATDQGAGTTQNGSFVGNATTITDSTRGTVLSLDGSGDSVSISSTFSNSNNVTIGGWVNLNTSSGRAEFISLDNRVHIALDETGGGVKGSIQITASSWLDLTSSRFIAGSGWHHVMYVMDDTNNVHSLYMDGELIASATNTNSIYWTGATTSYVGQHPTNSSWNLNGLADDIRIYNRALSLAEVAALAAGPTFDLDTITITVTPANDAPLLDNTGSMTLTTVTEDQTNNSGQTVASIIASAGGDRITDVDSGAVEGIAITATTNGNGSWEFSTNGGSTWSAVGSVSGSSSLLLRSTDLVRFVPNGQNASTGDITFRAWDQSSGTFGTKVDTSTNGSATAFSTATEVASITVTAVNDAPLATTDSATAVEAGGTSNGTAGTNPTGNVLTNDTDVDTGDTKTVTGVSAGVQASAVGSVASAVTGTYGSITIAANGAYTYTVDNNNATVQALRTSANTLTDVFTYTMRDTAGLTSTTQITVTIQGANDAPTDIALVGNSGTNLVTNGSFETNNGASNTFSAGASVTVSGWTAIGGEGFEVWKNFNSGGPGAASNGTSLLELDVAAGLNGISQNITTSAGQKYVLSFDFSGRSTAPTSSIEVYWQNNHRYHLTDSRGLEHL